jgi:hypothetical protein
MDRSQWARCRTCHTLHDWVLKRDLDRESDEGSSQRKRRPKKATPKRGDNPNELQ